MIFRSRDRTHDGYSTLPPQEGYSTLPPHPPYSTLPPHPSFQSNPTYQVIYIFRRKSAKKLFSLLLHKLLKLYWLRRYLSWRSWMPAPPALWVKMPEPRKVRVQLSPWHLRPSVRRGHLIHSRLWLVVRMVKVSTSQFWPASPGILLSVTSRMDGWMDDVD